MHSPAELRGKTGCILLAAIPAILVLWLQTSYGWPFFSDDSFITLRYAEHLLQGHGPVWNPGERVEGYSNLLWLLAIAGLGASGMDLVLAARLLGAGCVVLALGLLAAAARPRTAAATLSAAVPPLLLASTAPLVGWTLGGLEGPLVLLLLVAGGCRLLQLPPVPATGQLFWAGLPFALLCWTRPEAALWALAAGLVYIRRPRSMLAVGALPLLAVLLQLGFRLWFYGDYVPNTAHVKVEWNAALGRAGRDYFFAGAQVLAGFWTAVLLATAGALVAGGAVARRAVACCLLPTAAFLLFVTSIGGDHFPGFRMWLPALALPAVLLAWAAARIQCCRLLWLLAGLACVAANLHLSRSDPSNQHLRHEDFEWKAEVLGNCLRQAFAAASPLLAVDAAGALPYYSGLPALDMLGLNDRTIARTPTPAWALLAAPAAGLTHIQGHLRGNGRYVMDRQPDLMLFGPAPGLPLPVFLSAQEFEGDERYLRDYRCVLLDLGQQELRTGRHEQLRTPLWVRIAGRAGSQQTGAQWCVPAYLLGAYRQPRAFRFSTAPPAPEAAEFAGWKNDLDATFQWFTGGCHAFAVPTVAGPWELELRQHKPASLLWQLPAGRYRIEVDPPQAWQARLVPAEALADGSYRLQNAGDCELWLEPAVDARLPLRARQLLLERLGD